MKTLAEWFEMLPSDLRYKAIYNTKNHNNTKNLSDLAESLADAINSGFAWRSTSEGHDFWYDIHQIAKRGEYNAKSKTSKTSETWIPKIGERVIRGDGWIFDKQDTLNGVQQVGTVIGEGEWVTVEWDNIELIRSYRAKSKHIKLFSSQLKQKQDGKAIVHRSSREIRRGKTVSGQAVCGRSKTIAVVIGHLSNKKISL